MNLVEAPKEYLTSKKQEVLDFISSIPLPNELDKARIDRAIFRSLVEAPSLNLRERSARQVQEVPDYSLIRNMYMQQSGPYTGISVTIPVEGDWDLFLACMENRWVCNGFKIGSKNISIVQYDFGGNGLDLVKHGIKVCAESLEGILAEIASVVDIHNTLLPSEAEAAAQARREELLTGLQKNKDADPWG